MENSLCHFLKGRLISGISAELAKQGAKPCSMCANDSYRKINSVEIAHTFQLGDCFTKNFEALFSGKPLQMNCFGIGIGELFVK